MSDDVGFVGVPFAHERRLKRLIGSWMVIRLIFMNSASQTPSSRDSRTPSCTQRNAFDDRRKKIIGFLTSSKGALALVFASSLIFAICIILHNHVSNNGPLFFGAGLMILLFSVFYYLGTRTRERKSKQNK